MKQYVNLSTYQPIKRHFQNSNERDILYYILYIKFNERLFDIFHFQFDRLIG